jgi:hypothetical protein
MKGSHAYACSSCGKELDPWLVCTKVDSFQPVWLQSIIPCNG